MPPPGQGVSFGDRQRSKNIRILRHRERKSCRQGVPQRLCMVPVLAASNASKHFQGSPFDVCSAPNRRTISPATKAAGHTPIAS
eukprot:s2961_g7.t3